MTVTRLADFKEFPACDVLGYSLDFTTASPMDIKSVGVLNFLKTRNSRFVIKVLAAVKRGRRIIEYEPDEDTRKLEVGKYLQRISSFASLR